MADIDAHLYVLPTDTADDPLALVFHRRGTRRFAPATRPSLL